MHRVELGRMAHASPKAAEGLQGNARGDAPGQHLLLAAQAGQQLLQILFLGAHHRHSVVTHTPSHNAPSRERCSPRDQCSNRTRSATTRALRTARPTHVKPRYQAIAAGVTDATIAMVIGWRSTMGQCFSVEDIALGHRDPSDPHSNEHRSHHERSRPDDPRSFHLSP